MINFNRFHINILSVFISCIIFLIITLIINNNISKNESYSNTLNFAISTNNMPNQLLNLDIDIKDISEWKIEIKALNLKSNITEFKENSLNKASIKHIKNTSILGNNIALITNDYGTDNSYFTNLKDLSVGDKINYTVNNEKLSYEVISNKIIEKNSLEGILKDNNKKERYLKLFTYIKGIDDKLRYVCAKDVIDR